ncbi:MAG: GldG family protein, partial [Planctomycetes bacterium]|nr:GldG family protein [Planctomycetota bacterium]
MQSKKAKKLDLGISLVIIIGIAAVLNFFSYQIFYRWDLTQNKVYSISKVSKKTAGELNDIVNIKAYFSANLPSQFLALKQEVSDMLSEYEAYSNGKIRTEFIDPGIDEETQRELYMIGIPQLTFEIYEKDKLQMVNGYMGIAVSYGGKTEVIPAVKSDTSGLEYQITTAIKKAVSEEIATIGFLNAAGAVSLDGAISAAKKELEDLYTVREVAFSSDQTEIPADIDTLVIVGPKEEYTDNELKAVNAFLVRGGRLLALLDGVSIAQGLQASKNTTNLIGLLSKYGIIVNQDLAADTRNGMASFTQGFITFSSNYSFWPKITKEGFNQDVSAVANLENVILPWASTIDINPDIVSAESASFLAFTTDRGWRVAENFNVLPSNANLPQGTQKRHNLAVLLNGEMPDAYPEKDGEGKFVSRLIVVGDSDFLSDGFVGNTPDNLTL